MVEMAIAGILLIIMLFAAACFLYCFWYVLINDKGEEDNDGRIDENDHI